MQLKLYGPGAWVRLPVRRPLSQRDLRPLDDRSARRTVVGVHAARRRQAVQPGARQTPMVLVQYFDDVVERLAREGVDVAQVVLELSPTRPMRGQVVTGLGPVLRWREDLGWSNGARSTSPAADPLEVAELLNQLSGRAEAGSLGVV